MTTEVSSVRSGGTKSLYDDVGGEAGIRAVLRTLYDRLFLDVMVGYLFAGRDKEKLIEHQLWFTAGFLGGPRRYEGKSMPEAHASLPLFAAHFERRHEFLREALLAHRVLPRVAVEWLRVDRRLKRGILESGDDPPKLSLKDRSIAFSKETISEVMAFDAPYLIEKLVKDKIVEDATEAQALFREVKRYLLLCSADCTFLWEMHSLRVDQCWHEFVLFTFEYSRFCNRFFARYSHHAPSNSPPHKSDWELPPSATFEQFKAAYEAYFGESLPEIWEDHRSVTSNRRIINDGAGRMLVRVNGEKAELCDLLHDEPLVLICVDAWAESAIRFVAQTAAFYVRELPGDLGDDERVDLIAALVQIGSLRVAT